VQVLRRADARPQAPSAWDAWAAVHRDATADAAHREVRPPSADGAERSAAQAPDAQVLGAMCRQLELRAAPPAERDVAGPYTRAAARSAERSCAVPGAAEPLDGPQPEPMAERSRKPPVALPELESQAAVSTGASELR
jgi:hypothetical protein